jgi:hypothetical protein
MAASLFLFRFPLSHGEQIPYRHRKTLDLHIIAMLWGRVWRRYATDGWFQGIHQGRKMPLSRFRVLFCGMLATALIVGSRGMADDLPWQRSPWFEEQAFTAALEPAGRFHVNAPLDDAGRPARATRIIVYALPNGNTIEQTLGCRMAKGLDWHYDIQHVAAQVRLLRALNNHVAASLRDADASLGETRPREQIVLICAEAGGLSWPNWRRTHADANARIVRTVDDWRRQLGAEDCQITLTGHSGGGSFVFGVIEGSDEIPASIDRIAFLDANYSFDAKMHAEKLQRWLSGDASRRLTVLAYDDREIMLDGKKVVGPTGGTWRATGRMRDALGERFLLTEAIHPPFHETTGLDGRIRFYVHPNPEIKILHTVLVGEMNGLVHVATLGTECEGKWGTFGGPRAYTQWVQPEPMPSEPAQSRHPALPSRPADAIGGNEFIKSLEGLSLDDREAAILREITSGNFPNFLRNFKTVPLRGTITDENGDKEIAVSLEVMPDYLAVGSDDDFVRMPMTPQTAQRIADAFGCVLPTRKIVDAIDAQAELHLGPHPLSREREAVATFLEHQRIIERQRAGKPLGLLITGIKKDIVLTPRIFERPQRLAIYGWRQLDGQPIQPLTIVHWNRYVDYSHGARLVGNIIEIDGKDAKITDLLTDRNRCGLVSDEESMSSPGYPLD